MGTDIHIRIAKYNKETNLFEEVELFRKATSKEIDWKKDTNGFMKIYLNAGRDYEMFEGMKDGDEIDGYGYFPWTPINYLSLEPSFAERIKEKVNSFGYYDFYEINLCEFNLYLKNHPKVINYDADRDEEDPWKENPLKSLFDDIESYLFIADYTYSWTPSSYYKVIFYFDS